MTLPPSAVGRRVGPLLCAWALLVGVPACGDAAGRHLGQPCDLCEDGVYTGETDRGGAVAFEVAEGHLRGTFDLVADTGCGRLPLELGHVYLDGESFRSQMNDDVIVEVTGEMLASDEAAGRYEITWMLGEQSCAATGLWSARRD